MGQRIATTTIGSVLTAALVLGPVHASAATGPDGAWGAAAGDAVAASVTAYAKKKKKKKKPKPEAEEDPGPKITPEEAEAKRTAIRNSVNAARESGNWIAVAEGLEKNAPLLGDPVTMLEAGEARIEAAAKGRSADQANLAIEDTRAALDILHFYDAVASGQAQSQWLVIAPGDAASLIERGDSQIERAEGLIEEIEQEKVAAAAAKGDDDGDAKKQKKKKKRGGKAKPGTGMIAAGSVFTVAGVAGLSMIILGTVRSNAAQKQVEKLDEGDPDIETYDKIGKQSNNIAYAGVGVAVVGFAVGLPLVIIGAKRRKAAGDPPPSASVQRRQAFGVAPMLGRTQGIAIQGRF